MLLVAVWLWLLIAVLPTAPRSFRGRPFVPATPLVLRARKPDWVIEEVIRLKAHMAEAGCRRIAHTFNRLHAARHRTTVSKTWVAEVVRKRRFDIEERRSEWKRRVPRPMAANLIWGVDLTGKTDLAGTVHSILGIVDHGTRFAVSVRTLRDRTTIGILRALLDAIEAHGKPRAIRTDNDGVFTSMLLRFVVAVLGIRHQRTEPHCPWMNGRVERLIGTLKQKLDRWAVDSIEQLDLALGDFRGWYNNVRPHQHLHGLTPAEAWLRIDPFATVPKDARYFSAWDGMLTGFWMRR